MNLEWRVIELGRREGSFNTAVERVLFESVAEGTSKPVLLFTEWKPTVSLGNSQSYVLDVDHDACKKHDVEVIRRRSGGQAVYLDEGYVVFSAIAPPSVFGSNLTKIRNAFCDIMVETLQQMKVPAEFYPPSNVVINERTYRTLGNSGQILHPEKPAVLQGSIRHRMINLDTMLDVLKVNNHKLNSYAREIYPLLADVDTYNGKKKKEDVQYALLHKFLEKTFDGREGMLTHKELGKVQRYQTKEQSPEWVRGKSKYPSRGVCYFFLNGKNLVPSLQSILPYNKPSTVEDSTA